MMSVEAVDQSSSSQASKVSSFNRENMGKDAFLQLLVTQLRNQDPLNPMENMEFVAQLSQFSSLEQLWNVNETLMNNGDLTRSVHNALMTNLIGKNVKIPGNVLHLAEDTNQEMVYELAQPGKVTVQVIGKQGQVVRNIDVGLQDGGKHSVAWDGKDDLGKQVADDYYLVKVFSVDEQGTGAELPTYLVGKVTGLSFANGNPVLYIGSQEVNPSDIVAVYEATEVE